MKRTGHLTITTQKEKIDKKDILKLFIPDISLLLLIFSNLITIFFTIKQNWNIINLLWIYWFQSIIIGIFNFIKILTLKKFTTNNFKINDKPVEPTHSTKISTAFFFLFHYGGFHIAYLIFLLTGSFINFHTAVKTSLFLIILNILIFFVNHLFSFIYNYESDSKKIKNIGKVMFFPYARIIPMHLSIIFGIFLINNQLALLFFLILKTIADLIMHQVEHKL